MYWGNTNAQRQTSKERHKGSRQRKVQGEEARKGTNKQTKKNTERQAKKVTTRTTKTLKERYEGRQGKVRGSQAKIIIKQKK